MCGIAGIVGFQAQEALGAMLEVTHHRGPDDRGQWHGEAISLGMNRLAIQDLSAAGHQPMWSEDGRHVIVFNGEVYNFQSLRQELQSQGVSVQSGTDTEVVLKYYLQEGAKALRHFRGMFAFVVYDTQSQSYFAARDRVGIKPFYYQPGLASWAFASELKALVRSGLVAPELDEVALYQYLQYGHVLTPDTLLKGVKQLPPGHYLEGKVGEVPREVAYWKLHQATADVPSDFVDRQEAFYRLMDESVRLRMISDRPVGLFLSGGLDSSLILHHMVQHSPNVKAFSVGFEENPYTINEGTEAKATADHLGAEYQQVTLSVQEVMQDMPSFIQALDQPSVDGLNTFVVSKYAASEMTVALSGLGGDELFAGYTRQVLMHHRQSANRGAKSMAAGLLADPLIRAAWGTKTGDLLIQAKARLSAQDVGWVYGVGRTSHYPAALNSLGLAGAGMAKAMQTYWRDIAGQNQTLAQKLMALEIAGFMTPQLLRDMDPVSMWHSMEVRFPLIDHHVLAFAYQLPMADKLAPGASPFRREGESSYAEGGTKYLLQQVYRPHLPEGFMERKKNGFKLPLQQFWEQGLYQQFQDVLPVLRTVVPTAQATKEPFYLQWKLFILAQWLSYVQGLANAAPTHR